MGMFLIIKNNSSSLCDVQHLSGRTATIILTPRYSQRMFEDSSPSDRQSNRPSSFSLISRKLATSTRLGQGPHAHKNEHRTLNAFDTEDDKREEKTAKSKRPMTTKSPKRISQTPKRYPRQAQRCIVNTPPCCPSNAAISPLQPRNPQVYNR